MLSKVEVLRFYRPEDISQEEAYRSGFWDVFASSEKLCVSIESIVGHCKVAVAVDAPEGESQTSELSVSSLFLFNMFCGNQPSRSVWLSLYLVNSKGR